MGCFFNCFGARDDRSTNHTESKGKKVSENRLSSLFLVEEKADSLFPNEDRGGLNSTRNDKGLKDDEARFLKACGTTLENPMVIENSSRDLEGSNSDTNLECLGFNSSPSNKLGTKFQLNEKLDEPSSSINACEELGRRSFSMEQTPSSCTTNVQNSGGISASCEVPDEEQQQSIGLHDLSSGNTRGLNRSVKDEEPPIRSHLSHSFPDQGEGLSLPMVPESKPMKQSSETQVFTDQNVDQTEMKVEKVEETAPEKDFKVETSGSPGLKSPPTSNDDYNENVGALSSKTPSFGKPRTERPIIGLVALHWNKEESPHVSGWDGNGIPNSTNKYKEDQKVSWHATSFEERLEKALSEESFTSQRKRFPGTQMVLDENEGDTAASQLRRSANANSVASF